MNNESIWPKNWKLKRPFPLTSPRETEQCTAIFYRTSSGLESRWKHPTALHGSALLTCNWNETATTYCGLRCIGLHFQVHWFIGVRLTLGGSLYRQAVIPSLCCLHPQCLMSQTYKATVTDSVTKILPHNKGTVTKQRYCHRTKILSHVLCHRTKILPHNKGTVTLTELSYCHRFCHRTKVLSQVVSQNKGTVTELCYCHRFCVTEQWYCQCHWTTVLSQVLCHRTTVLSQVLCHKTKVLSEN